MIRSIILCVVLAACSYSHAADALRVVNLQRRYLGLPALQQDPQLQSRAEWAVQQRAVRGKSGHLNGSPVAGRKEGVGWQSSSDSYGIWFTSCYTRATDITYAGAAYYVHNGRTYYQFNAR